MRRGITIVVTVLVALLASCGTLPSARAQEQRPGPIAAPQPDVRRISPNKLPDPPPIPAEEIIREFAKKEDEFARARASYSYRKNVRIVELGEDGKANGEFQITTEPSTGADGKRYEKIIAQPNSTLKRMRLAPEDLDLFARIPPFPFTTENLPQYEITYAGKQPVDELNTYVFRIKPRQLERARAYFEGLVWVDDHDLAIVKSYGKWVTETGSVTAAAEAPFALFETYREFVDGKYWFPNYSRSDASIQTKNGEVGIRLVIRWQDYKPEATKQPQP